MFLPRPQARCNALEREPGFEIVQQASKSEAKHPNRSEPLGLVYVGLVLFTLVSFVHPQDWTPALAAVPFAKIAGILILVSLVFTSNTIRWHMPLEVTFLSLLTAQLWLTVPFSPVWRGGAFQVMLDFSKVLPVVIVIHGAVRSMRRLRWILFVQAASIAAITIISIVNSQASSDRLRGVLPGVYGNSNDFAFGLDLSLPFCFAFALTTRSTWKKLIWTIAMLAMVYAVFLTASRGGAIALVAVAVVCLWQLGVKSRRFYLLLLVLVTVIVIWLYSGNALRERLDQTNIDPATNNRSTSASESALQRKELLFQSLKVTAQHPLFGVGPGNFQVVSGMWRVTHNSYTQMSAEGGIPAFILYLLFLWSGIANLRDVNRHSKEEKGIQMFSMALRASLAGYFVGSFFASVAYQLFPYCLVAYTGALRLIVYKERTVPSVVPKPHPTSTGIEVTVWQ